MKYLVGLLLGGLMEDPEPRFGNPYLIVEAPDEKTARKLYNEATNAYYFYGDVMGQETDNGWGYLIGTGGLNLSAEEAAKIQDDFGNWIVETLSKKKE